MTMVAWMEDRTNNGEEQNTLDPSHYQPIVQLSTLSTLSTKSTQQKPRASHPGLSL